MTNDDFKKLWEETCYYIDIAGLSRKLLLFYTGGYSIKQALLIKNRELVEQRVQRFHDAMYDMLNEGLFPWIANEHKDDLTGWLFAKIDSYI